MELSGFTRSNVNRSDDSRPIDEKDSWVGGDPKILRGLFVQIVTDRDSDRVFGKKILKDLWLFVADANNNESQLRELGLKLGQNG